MRVLNAGITGVIAQFALASMSANAQTSQADICRAQSIGLTSTMKIALGLEQPKDVALDHAGLRPGGPRRQLASLAYSRLESGASESTVEGEVRARCMELDRDVIANDDSTVDEQPKGASAHVCADVASSVAGFLEDPGTRTASVDELLDQFTSSRPHDDERSLPELRRTLQLAQQQARIKPGHKSVADFVMKHCRSLKPEERTALDAEFYDDN